MKRSYQPTISWSDVTVVNVVVTCTLFNTRNVHWSPDEVEPPRPISYQLEDLAEKLHNVQFNPSRFAALKLCLPNPFSKGLFFRSGKLVCVGNTTIVTARAAVEHFAGVIGNATGEALYVHDLKVQNIVGSCRMLDTNWSIDLARMATTMPHHTQYEPELFPGLSFRCKRTQVVLVIFASGKMNITGARSYLEMSDALAELRERSGQSWTSFYQSIT